MSRCKIYCIIFILAVFCRVLSLNSDCFSQDTFTITATAQQNGKIEPSGDIVVKAGEEKTFSMKPDKGYSVDDVMIDNISIGAVTEWTFSPIDANHVIKVSFKEDISQQKEEETPPEQKQDIKPKAKPELPIVKQETAVKQPEWVSISGKVLYKDKPLCGLILVNEQYTFSCDKSLGNYELKVLSDEKNEITLQAFCEGFAPFKQVLKLSETKIFDIKMSLAAKNSRKMKLDIKTGKGVRNPKAFKVSGSVSDGKNLLCAMIIANQKFMFSCDKNLGKYDMETPLNKDGQIVVLGFAQGFLPFKKILKP